MYEEASRQFYGDKAGLTLIVQVSCQDSLDYPQLNLHGSLLFKKLRHEQSRLCAHNSSKCTTCSLLFVHVAEKHLRIQNIDFDGHKYFPSLRIVANPSQTATISAHNQPCLLVDSGI